MLSNLLAVVVFTLGATAASSQQSSKPGCVNKCWDYSQYVSSCAGDTACLCDDADFQSAVYQCLYSQCATAQFASALHHALAVCQSDERHHPQPTIPALVRQQEGGLRKRQYQSNSVSVSVSNSVQPTATRGMQSVSASVYPTRTASPYPSGSAGAYPSGAYPSGASPSGYRKRAVEGRAQK